MRGLGGFDFACGFVCVRVLCVSRRWVGVGVMLLAQPFQYMQSNQNKTAYCQAGSDDDEGGGIEQQPPPQQQQEEEEADEIEIDRTPTATDTAAPAAAAAAGVGDEEEETAATEGSSNGNGDGDGKKKKKSKKKRVRDVFSMVRGDRRRAEEHASVLQVGVSGLGIFGCVFGVGMSVCVSHRTYHVCMCTEEARSPPTNKTDHPPTNPTDPDTTKPPQHALNPITHTKPNPKKNKQTNKDRHPSRGLPPRPLGPLRLLRPGGADGGGRRPARLVVRAPAAPQAGLRLRWGSHGGWVTFWPLVRMHVQRTRWRSHATCKRQWS